MANMGKQYVSSRPAVPHLGLKKSKKERPKFPQSAHHDIAPSATTDLSDYRQPQPGEMIANVMKTYSNSNSSSPPNQMKGRQLQAPRQNTEIAIPNPQTQLKAAPRTSLPMAGVVQPMMRTMRTHRRLVPTVFSNLVRLNKDGTFPVKGFRSVQQRVYHDNREQQKVGNWWNESFPKERQMRKKIYDNYMEDKAHVTASANITIDGEIIWESELVRSGADAENENEYKYYTENTKDRTDEERISANDAEGKLLTKLSKKIENEETWKKMLTSELVEINIQSTKGPCDGCKERIKYFNTQLATKRQQTSKRHPELTLNPNHSFFVSVYYSERAQKKTRRNIPTTYGFSGDVQVANTASKDGGGFYGHTWRV